MEKFKQLLRMEIENGRYIVVSKTVDGKISIAQQIQVVDNNQKQLLLFLKNALLMDVEVFKNFAMELVDVDLDDE